jgi:hypothetical protein
MKFDLNKLVSTEFVEAISLLSWTRLAKVLVFYGTIFMMLIIASIATIRMKTVCDFVIQQKELSLQAEQQKAMKPDNEPLKVSHGQVDF